MTTSQCTLPSTPPSLPQQTPAYSKLQPHTPFCSKTLDYMHRLLKYVGSALVLNLIMGWLQINEWLADDKNICLVRECISD